MSTCCQASGRSRNGALGDRTGESAPPAAARSARGLQVVAIRLVSLVVVLALWQVVGATSTPVALHHAERHRARGGRR